MKELHSQKIAAHSITSDLETLKTLTRGHWPCADLSNFGTRLPSKSLEPHGVLLLADIDNNAQNKISVNHPASPVAENPLKFCALEPKTALGTLDYFFMKLGDAATAFLPFPIDEEHADKLANNWNRGFGGIQPLDFGSPLTPFSNWDISLLDLDSLKTPESTVDVVIGSLHEVLACFTKIHFLECTHQISLESFTRVLHRLATLIG